MKVIASFSKSQHFKIRNRQHQIKYLLWSVGSLLFPRHVQGQFQTSTEQVLTSKLHLDFIIKKMHIYDDCVYQSMFESKSEVEVWDNLDSHMCVGST